jgi:acetyltransferase
MPPDLRIRPLHAADAERVQDFVRRLSPQSRRERYFSAIRELTPRQLERTTQPHDPRDLSLGAFHADALIGVAEYAAGEFGVAVADEWQGSGLGRELLRRLVAHAEHQSAPALHGLVNAGNRAMLRLAASFGFRSARDADPDLVRVELPLSHA